MEPSTPLLQAKLGKSGERWRQLNRFVDTYLRTLSPAAALTWLAMFRHAKPDGLVRVSQARIAAMIGRETRTVRSAQRQLERRGFLTVIARGALNRRPSFYAIHASPRLGAGEDQHSGRELPL